MLAQSKRSRTGRMRWSPKTFRQGTAPIGRIPVVKPSHRETYIQDWLSTHDGGSAHAWLGVTLVYADGSTSGNATGSYKADTIEEALAALELTLDQDITIVHSYQTAGSLLHGGWETATLSAIICARLATIIVYRLPAAPPSIERDTLFMGSSAEHVRRSWCVGDTLRYAFGVSDWP